MQEETSVLLNASASELAAADRVIAELGGRLGPTDGDGLYRYLIDHAHSALDIQRPQPTPRLWRARRLTVLQALSGGDDVTTGNPRLSLYTFEGRASDRDDLALLAESLAPRGASLRGYALSEATDLLPSASRGKESAGPIGELDQGTLVIRDAQSLCLHDRDVLFGVLRAVAGEGRLSRRARRTSADAAPPPEFPARCALHLSGDPGESRWRSALPPLRGTRSAAALNDESDHLAAQRARGLGLPLSLLLAVDVALNLDEDEDVEAELMDDLMDPRPQRSQGVRDAALREARVLVARLRDRFARVDQAPVASSLRRAESDLLVLLRDCVPQKDTRTPREPGLDAEGQLGTMMITLRKLVAASARSGGRGVAAPEDVGVAWRMLQLKLEVLRWLCGDHAVRKLPPRALLLQKAHERRRQDWELIRSRCGGQARTAAEVADAVGLPVHVARRELREHALPCQAGRFAVPALAAAPARARTRSHNEADLLTLGFAPAGMGAAPAEIDSAERSEAQFIEERERRAEVGVIPIMGSEDPCFDGTTSEYDYDLQWRRGQALHREWAEVLPALEGGEPLPVALGPLPEVPLPLAPLIERWASLEAEGQRRLGQVLLRAVCANDEAAWQPLRSSAGSVPGLEGELGKQLTAELSRRGKTGGDQAALLVLALFAETPFAAAATLLSEALADAPRAASKGRLAEAITATQTRLRRYEAGAHQGATR